MISVYDIETLKNLFTCTFLNIRTEEVRSFVIAEWRNDYKEFKEFFLRHRGLIGYNNVDFDYRVCHPFLAEDHNSLTGKELVKLIYKRSQKVIDENFDEERALPLVPQRDLYRIHHFNNKARAVSLKYLQINMGWHTVQDMPFAHDAKVKESDVPLILDYNLNDVKSTFEFYKRSRNKIRLRNRVGEMYGVDMGNFADNKIGETIFLKELAKRTGQSEKAIRKGRTPRKNINVSDCLVEGISFKSKEFNKILDEYRGMVVNNTKKDRKKKLFTVFDGVKYEFGFGGLHALRSPGHYTLLTSADVSSYYPNLAIGHKIYPQHLGPVFCEVYKRIYDERKKYAKGSDEDTAFKAALVCVFGASNAGWSMFYDPAYLIKITINGQLLLAMLCEEITLSGAGRVIMANTDGIEVDVNDKTLFKEICFRWQHTHKLLLEYTEYSHLYTRDVNNYLAIKTDGKIKTKGAFETEKEVHKAQNMKIVTRAVNDYFVKGIPIEKTINECRDISLFLFGKRARTGNLEYRTANTGSLVKQKMPKNVRYYVSRTGGSLVKVLKTKVKGEPNTTLSLFESTGITLVTPERIVDIHSGYRQTIFNNWVDKPFEEYGVEKQFYIREAKKLIESVINNQTMI